MTSADTGDAIGRYLGTTGPFLSPEWSGKDAARSALAERGSAIVSPLLTNWFAGSRAYPTCLARRLVKPAWAPTTALRIPGSKSISAEPPISLQISEIGRLSHS